MWDDRRDCTHHPEDSACYDEADGVLRNSPGWLALGFQLIPAPSLTPFSWIVSKSRAPRATSISARIVRTSRSSSACGPPTCDRECVASLRSDLPPTSLSSLKIAVSARAAGSLPPRSLIRSITGRGCVRSHRTPFQFHDTSTRRTPRISAQTTINLSRAEYIRHKLDSRLPAPCSPGPEAAAIDRSPTA